MMIVVKLEQFWKAPPTIKLSSILETLLGIVTDFKLLQPLNVPPAIIDNFSDNFIEPMLLQSLNAELPIEVTLFGISIDSREVQPINAPYPIVLILDPKVIFIIE
jgi:hypothetical protein